MIAGCATGKIFQYSGIENAWALSWLKIPILSIISCLNIECLPKKTIWNKFIPFAYIVKSIKNQKGKTSKMDLPLLKYVITTYYSIKYLPDIAEGATTIVRWYGITLSQKIQVLDSVTLLQISQNFRASYKYSL